MKSKQKRPPRPVPELTPTQEAFLTAITDSKQFATNAVMARHAGAVRVHLMHDTLNAADFAMSSTLEPKKCL